LYATEYANDLFASSGKRAELVTWRLWISTENMMKTKLLDEIHHGEILLEDFETDGQYCPSVVG